MLIQSQLSCNLLLLLICRDYAICARVFRRIGKLRIHRSGAAQSRKMRESRGKSTQMLPVLLPVIICVSLIYNPSVDSQARGLLTSCYLLR